MFRKTLPLRNVLFYKIDRANSRAKLTENIFFLIKICPFYTIIRGHLVSKHYAEHTFTFSKVLRYFDNFLRQNLATIYYENFTRLLERKFRSIMSPMMIQSHRDIVAKFRESEKIN